MKTITEDNIVKECIVAFAVTETSMKNGTFVDTKQLVDNMDEWMYLADGAHIVGVVPAPAMTFGVYGVSDDGCRYRLGTEFEGASNPNWVDVFKRMMRVI